MRNSAVNFLNENTTITDISILNFLLVKLQLPILQMSWYHWETLLAKIFVLPFSMKL